MISYSKRFALSPVYASLLLAGVSANASLVLSDLPLVIQTQAPPNIFFVMDINRHGAGYVAMQASQTTGQDGDVNTYDPSRAWACQEGDGKLMLPPSRIARTSVGIYDDTPGGSETLDPTDEGDRQIIEQWPTRVQASFERAQPVKITPYVYYDLLQYDPNNLEYFEELAEADSEVLYTIDVHPLEPDDKYQLARNVYFPVFDRERKFWLRHAFDTIHSSWGIWPIERSGELTGQDFNPNDVCFFDPDIDPMGWESGDPYPYYDLIYTVGGDDTPGQPVENMPTPYFWLYAQVPGNYAGWYLRADNTDPVWSVGPGWEGTTSGQTYALIKPQVISRFQVYKDAVSSILDVLVTEQIRARVALAVKAYANLGSMTLESDSAGKILVAIDDLFARDASGAIVQNSDAGISHEDRFRTALAGVTETVDADFTIGQHAVLADIGLYLMMREDGSIPTNISVCPGDSTACNNNSNSNNTTTQIQGTFVTQDAFVPNYRLVDGVVPPIFDAAVPANKKPSQGHTAILENGFCQKNFVVMLGSGEYMNRGDQFWRHSTLHNYLYDNYPDSGFLDPRSIQHGPPFFSTHENLLYSQANWATILHDIDLRPDLSGKNNASVYYIGLIDKTMYSQPVEELRKVTQFSGGQTFAANNTQELLESFRSVLTDIMAQSSDINSGAIFNSSRISGESLVFLASYDSSNWTGDLKAYTIESDGAVDFASPQWSAAQQLDCLSPALEQNCPTLDNDAPSSFADRKVFTHNGSIGVTFTWNNLSSAQRTDLGGSEQDAQLGNDRIDYLMGRQSVNGRDFPVRQSRLGDIVRSAPVYVGQPSDYIDDVDREPMIYVGANDGMLHAFNANHGYEEFAYIPAALSSPERLGDGGGLHRLTDPDYNHRFYVDLTPTVAEVEIGGSWKTILVGGTGSGGKGLFALDITDPANFAANKVLWEVQGESTTTPNGNDTAELGYTFSRPTITKVNHQGGRWAVITSSGYNASDTQEARLYILDAADGSVIKEITVPSSSLSTPTTYDLDGNGTADRAYAGDLQGRMWAFDLNGNGPGTWRVAHSLGNTSKPLFTASHQATVTDEAGNQQTVTTVQPITAEPAIVAHPTQQGSDTAPNLLVLFGTGQYLEVDDIEDPTTQTFYAIWDKGQPVTLSDQVQLLSRTVTLRQNAQINGTDQTISVRTFDNNNTDMDWGQYVGWYIDFGNSEGERFITNPVIRGPFVHFNSMIPDDTVCSTGGRGYAMAACVASGSTSCGGSFDFNVTVDTDGTSTTYQPMGLEISAIPWQSIFIQGSGERDHMQVPLHLPDTAGNLLLSAPLQDLTPPQRMSWREVTDN